ncbi:PilT protein domain protein [Candidatus Protofrankia californiensis]|uniref:PilT protein domain protein n=1 Tax=Candidatus Protofrankia californiensis TaxID=1839754 RepID=A0A1C3P697_9ACTN|nr:PilT protein domain protein [Candidatus Protofrankia californiensis]
MTPVLVDSNVLLDVLGDDPRWGDWSADAIAAAADEAQLVINPVIYAEVSVRYPRIEELDNTLRPEVFRRDGLPYPAAFLAGKAYTDYRRRGGSRTSPLPDFLIGAHAAVAGYRLLTRDATRYRTYFPKVGLIAP